MSQCQIILCSGAEFVDWNLHFLPVHLVYAEIIGLACDFLNEETTHFRRIPKEP